MLEIREESERQDQRLDFHRLDLDPAQCLSVYRPAGFWIFMMRQMQSGGNKALSFGKSRARLHSTQQKKVTFKDVAGVEEAKEELQEIIEFLSEPQNFRNSAAVFPRAC